MKLVIYTARLLLLVVLSFWPFQNQTAKAHTASTGYLTIETNGDQPRGTVKIEILDINRIVPLDANFDGKITWGETKAARSVLEGKILTHLKFSQANKAPCTPELENINPEQINNSYYLAFSWNAACSFSQADPVTLNYDLLFDIDRSHVAIATIDRGEPIIFKYGDSSTSLKVESPSRLKQVGSFLWQGIWHIFIGYDHILFILTLVLAVIKASSGNFFYQLLKVITAFTIAHSLTLFLVATGAISLPSQLVESVIALSIVLGAINNLWPFLPGTTATLAFVFGLIHGFGFASVLQELNPSAGSLVISVLSFNVGVEFGQIVIVAVALPVFTLARRAGYFDFWIYKLGSIAVSLVSLIWLFERVTSIPVF